MRRKYIVPAVVMTLVLAVLGMSAAFAAIGDVFAVGRDSAGNDLFRITRTGSAVLGGPLVQKRLGTATNVTLTTSNALVGVTDTSVARGIYMPDASSCDVGHTVVVVDESGGAATHNILVYGAGTDTINGGPTKTLGQAYGSLRLYKGQDGKWFTF